MKKKWSADDDTLECIRTAAGGFHWKLSSPTILRRFMLTIGNDLTSKRSRIGRAGIMGISYDGFTALQTCVDPHPALKASSPQASIVDMFIGDDFHHNGAFRLSYGFEYSYAMEHAKDSQHSQFNQYFKFGIYLLKKRGNRKQIHQP